MEMYTAVVRAQTFLQHVDREFEIMNTCAKSVKSIFLNFGRVYREIAEGGKTVDEAIKSAGNNIPEELRSNLSDLFSLTQGASLSSLETDCQEKRGSQKSTSVDIDFSKIKPGTDTEDSGCNLHMLNISAKDILSSTVLSKPGQPEPTHQ